MKKIEIEKYIRIAKSAKIFDDAETKILEEILTDYQNNPETSYIIFEEKKDEDTLGFIIFGKVPMTEFCWDIYWVIVDKKFQRKGIGKKLLKRMEKFIFDENRKATLRIETSEREEYIPARKLYIKHGFREAGRIPNFYRQGDSLIIFYKELKEVKSALKEIQMWVEKKKIKNHT